MPAERERDRAHIIEAKTEMGRVLALNLEFDNSKKAFLAAAKTWPQLSGVTFTMKELAGVKASAMERCPAALWNWIQTQDWSEKGDIKGDYPGGPDPDDSSSELVKLQARILELEDEKKKLTDDKKRLTDDIDLVRADLESARQGIPIAGVSQEEYDKAVRDAEAVALAKVDEEVEAALVDLCRTFEVESVQELQAKWSKLVEISGQHRIVLGQLETHQKQVDEVVSMGHIPAPLPFPLPQEREERTKRYGDSLAARVMEEPQRDLNFTASPLIHSTLDDLVYRLAGVTGLKKQGLKKQLGALGILMLYSAFLNVPDDSWDHVSPLRKDPTGDNLLFNDLGVLLLQRIVAKPVPVGTTGASPAEDEAAATGEV